jgi:hypothetical protein
MAWNVGKVQDTSIGRGPALPGFTIQQQGRSPTMTIIFDDQKTAQECADLMQAIVARAAVMRGHD